LQDYRSGGFSPRLLAAEAASPVGIIEWIHTESFDEIGALVGTLE
jgi:hypothetical protein